jgi:hypothetical protein
VPVTTHCPVCGYQLTSQNTGERIDRKAVLAIYDGLPGKQVDVLFFLHRFVLASQQQISDTFFDAENPRDRKISASKHLASLLNKGLVERHVGGPRHNGKVFYSLTPSGMFACEVEARGGTRNVKRLRDVKAHSLLSSVHAKHHLAVVDVMASFVRAERRGEGELLTYAGDKETTFSFVHLGSRRKIQPDSALLWSSNNRAFNAFLELENRKSSSEQFVEKIVKYLWFSQAGNNVGDVYKQTLGVNSFPPLLVVAVRKGQLPGLRQATIKGVLEAHVGTLPEVSKRVVVALAALDDIRETSVFGECWQAPLQARGPMGFEELFSLR